MKKTLISLVLIVSLIVTPVLMPVLVLAQGGFVGDPQGKVAVTPKDYDNIGAVLQDMGYNPDIIQESSLADLSVLQQYDAIYINCSENIDNEADAAAAALKQYVQNGGIVYASDWANSVVQKAFPGKLNFYKINTGLGAYDDLGKVGASGRSTTTVVDSGLAEVIGSGIVEIYYDFPGWAVLDSVANDVNVLITGQVKIDSYFGSEANTLNDKTLAVTFTEGKGEVLYTTFHNEAQVTSEVEKVLQWFAVRVKAGKLVQENRSLATSETAIFKEITDSLNPGESKNYEFTHDGVNNFNLVLNFVSGKVNVKVVDPNGDVILNQDVSETPFIQELSGVKGIYKVELIGLQVENNMPFVTTFLDSGKTATVVGFFEKYRTYILVGGAVVGILIIGAVVIVVVLGKRKPAV